MHEKQLRFSILKIFMLQFLSTFTNIPYDDSSICRTTREHTNIKWRPFTAQNLFLTKMNNKKELNINIVHFMNKYL